MLELKNICSGYEELVVIRDLSLSIKAGDIISIIGRNGVGKSTLAKTIIGLIKCRSGSIIYEGEDITKFEPYDRARLGIAYVPQGHGVFPLLSVEENLQMGACTNSKMKKLDLSIAYEYFPRLEERKVQKAGTLSGGEQAMLSIARALVGKPKMIILDEPSEGIQPNLVTQIGEIVKKSVKDLGITVILNEQHMGLIQDISEVCYAIDKGQIVGKLSAEQLRDYDEIKKYLTV